MKKVDIIRVLIRILSSVGKHLQWKTEWSAWICTGNDFIQMPLCPSFNFFVDLCVDFTTEWKRFKLNDILIQISEKHTDFFHWSSSSSRIRVTCFSPYTRLQILHLSMFRNAVSFCVCTDKGTRHHHRHWYRDKKAKWTFLLTNGNLGKVHFISCHPMTGFNICKYTLKWKASGREEKRQRGHPAKLTGAMRCRLGKRTLKLNIKRSLWFPPFLCVLCLPIIIIICLYAMNIIAGLL